MIAEQRAAIASARDATRNGTGIVRDAVPNPVPPSEAARKAIAYATAQLGKPYVWGATGPDAYDCSGLTQGAFSASGRQLPRVASAQYAATQRVGSGQAAAGDLVFWGGANAHHVGIYLGNGQVVHAPRTGDVVKVSPIWGNPEFGRVG
jgi:cell wall-associated NlpC family hydrolase